MDAVEVFLFVSLELAVLLGIAVFLLNRNRRQLLARLQELAREDSPPDNEAFDSITSGYLPYLENLILESRDQLEASGAAETGTAPDDPTVEAIRYRLSLLEAEKKVVELCNDYPDRRWQHITELFTPPEETTEEPAEDGDDLAKLREKIKRLEKFRDHFFSMKKQLQELETSRQKLSDQLEALIPEAERSEALQTLLDTMNEQRDRLQAELDQLESQSDELAKTARQDTHSQEEKDETTSELAAQLDKQKRKIFELHHLVDDLHLEAEKAEALQTTLDQFDLANRDMNMCIQVLEEENQFLQEQIKSLLKLGESESVYQADTTADEKNPEPQEQLETLRSELEDKNRQIKSLEEKYAAMEQEYLTLYEEVNS